MKTSQLRICIPIPERKAGGMHTFLRNWRGWLDQREIVHTQSLSDSFDILFVNSWAVPYATVKRVKQNRPNVRIVQRLDGSADDYGRFGSADMIQARVNTLADLTIFQSNYSRYSTREKFRIVAKDGPIIHNPVDVTHFNPAGSKRDFGKNTKVCVVSFSTNKLKGTWQISKLAEENPQLTFILCGNFPPLPNCANIVHLGHLNHTALAEVMRSCDVYLHLAINDPCPNVVTEALASGLPVLYYDSGGTAELVGEAGIPMTVDNFRQRLETVIQEHMRLSTFARKRAESKFAPSHIFPQYLQAIERARPTTQPTWKALAKLQWQGYPVLPIHHRYLQAAARAWFKKFGRISAIANKHKADHR